MKLKKPKFWDYKRPNLVAYLLFPLSLILRLLKSLKIETKLQKPKIKTICVGNIYIGGTGKTSLCIKINELLNKKNIKSCFIKKHYSKQIDEQKLLQGRGKLFTSAKRIDALDLASNSGYEVAILDDGLQDNTLSYDLSFVCFNNLNWIGNGLTIPSGPLRENINSLEKHQHIFLNGNLENLNDIKNYLFKINPSINVHIGKYVPLNIDEFNKEDKYLMFSGIGNHNTFLNMLKNYNLKIVKDLEYPDHYNYTNYDINEILSLAKDLDCKIITTEKDYLRLEEDKVYKINFIKSDLKIVDEDRLISTILKINENN